LRELPPIEAVLVIATVIFFAIGLHEFAHCKLADAAGDPTPRYYGRVTLNLTKHFELMGTIMIIITSISGFGIGWGKPAPMDPSKMRNPKWDFFAAVAAGPIANFLQAVVYGMTLRAALAANVSLHPLLVTFLVMGAMINLSLMFFNLIPFGPLDGHYLLGTFLPDRQRHQWFLFNRTTGMFLLFGLILLSQFAKLNLIGSVIGVPVNATFRFLTGIPLNY
jgi:Zn-dependent protease